MQNERGQHLKIESCYKTSLGSLLSHNKGLAQTGKKHVWQQEKVKGTFFIYTYTYIHRYTVLEWMFGKMSPSSILHLSFQNFYYQSARSRDSVPLRTSPSDIQLPCTRCAPGSVEIGNKIYTPEDFSGWSPGKNKSPGKDKNWNHLPTFKPSHFSGSNCGHLPGVSKSRNPRNPRGAVCSHEAEPPTEREGTKGHGGTRSPRMHSRSCERCQGLQEKATLVKNVTCVCVRSPKPGFMKDYQWLLG